MCTYRVSRFRKEEGKLSLSYIKLHPDLYKNVSIVSLWQTEGDDLRYRHLAPLNTSCSCGAPPISCHHYLCPAFHDVIITRLECNVHTPHICPYVHHCTALSSTSVILLDYWTLLNSNKYTPWQVFKESIFKMVSYFVFLEQKYVCASNQN